MQNAESNGLFEVIVNHRLVHITYFSHFLTQKEISVLRSKNNLW